MIPHFRYRRRIKPNLRLMSSLFLSRFMKGVAGSRQRSQRAVVRLNVCTNLNLEHRVAELRPHYLNAICM